MWSTWVTPAQALNRVDDTERVDPQHSAFLSAVIRYLTLRHAPDATVTTEWSALRRTLADEPLGAMRPAWEQRSYWRMDFSPMPAMLRKNGIDYPCHLLDLSASGARITDASGQSKVSAKAGDTVILSLRPRRATIRIELPIEVVHHESETGTFGVRFRGAPLVTHQRDTVGHLRKRVVDRARQAEQARQQLSLQGGDLPPTFVDAPIVADPAQPAANDSSVDFHVA